MEAVNSEVEESEKVEGTEGEEEIIEGGLGEENEITEDPEEVARNKTTRILTCHLKDPDILEISEKLADGLEYLRSLEDDKSSSSSRFNSLIKVEKEKADNLVKLIKNKIENREIECQYIINWNENKKNLVRLDTNEVIESNALTYEERQTEMEYKGFSEDDVAEGGDKEKGEEEAC